MNSAIVFILSQLLSQAPVLLAYLAGIVICAVLWRRAPRAALLAMLATVLMLVTLVGTSVLQSQMIMNRAPGTNYTPLAILGIAGALARAAAFMLLLIAVFTGRPRRETMGFEVGMHAA